MKKSKKMLLYMAACFLGLCMCSCSGTSGQSRKLVKEGSLCMATNASFPPYEYYSGDKIIGIDAEIGQIIADELGLKLEINDMNFDVVIDSVKNGENDIALSTLTITDERKKLVDFTDPYAYGIQSVIVKEDSDIRKADDLADAEKIGVQKGSTGEAYCVSDFGESRVEAYNRISTALLDLDSGIIDAIVTDHDASVNYVDENAGLRVLDTEYVREEYGIGISKENDVLKDEINAVLREMEESGQLNAIIDKYIEKTDTDQTDESEAATEKE